MWNVDPQFMRRYDRICIWCQVIVIWVYVKYSTCNLIIRYLDSHLLKVSLSFCVQMEKACAVFDAGQHSSNDSTREHLICYATHHHHHGFVLLTSKYTCYVKFKSLCYILCQHHHGARCTRLSPFLNGSISRQNEI